jgi:flagellin
MHNDALSRATERLATGKRINQAKDDPFRNYEAKNIVNETTSGVKAKQNSADGTSLLQIAEGACTEIQNVLQRVRELAIQSANDTLKDTERRYLNMESEALLKEAERIAASAIFNEKQIFGLGPDAFSSSKRTLENGKQVTVGILHVGTGANPNKVNDVNEIRVSIPDISVKYLGLENLVLEDNASSVKAIDDLDSAINSLSTIRSYMGSLVNRLDMEVEKLETRDISLNDYVGKISDTDFAKESTAFMSAQIQQQATISILAQCNARISKVLEILG